MDRLTWECKDGGMYVDSGEVERLECDDVEICTGNAIIKLAKYEDIGLEPEEVFQVRNIAMAHLKESLKENDRAIRRARMLGIDATEIRQASAEMERFLVLLSTGLNI